MRVVAYSGREGAMPSKPVTLGGLDQMKVWIRRYKEWNNINSINWIYTFCKQLLEVLYVLHFNWGKLQCHQWFTYNEKGSGRLCLFLWSAAAAACKLNIGSWWLARNVGGRDLVGRSPNRWSLIPDAIDAGENSIWLGCDWWVVMGWGDKDGARFDPGLDCSSSWLVDLVSVSSSCFIVLLFSRATLSVCFSPSCLLDSLISCSETLMLLSFCGLCWLKFWGESVSSLVTEIGISDPDVPDGVLSPSDGLHGPTTIVWVFISVFGSGITTFSGASICLSFSSLSGLELVQGWVCPSGMGTFFTSSVLSTTSSSTSLMSMCSFSSWSLSPSSWLCPSSDRARPPSALDASPPSPDLPPWLAHLSLFLHLALLFWNHTCREKTVGKL